MELHKFDLTPTNETHDVQVLFSETDYVVLSQFITSAFKLTIKDLSKHQETIHNALSMAIDKNPENTKEYVSTMQFCNKFILTLATSYDTLVSIYPLLEKNQI